MTIKKTTVLMAAVLAIATVLAAGLTVLPGSVQEAQANPCSTSGGRDLLEQSGQGDVDINCDLYGNFEITEGRLQ